MTMMSPFRKIAAGKLFDPVKQEILENQLITVNVQTGIIVDVLPAPNAVFDLDWNDPSVIDLRSLTVLPVFVDVHVHMFLHPYSETPWEDQVTKESIVERTVRATLHAKKTLLAGFTTVRDLGTEGAEDSDIYLRKCLTGPAALIPGPRYFCANRALVSTGGYQPKSVIHVNQEGIESMMGAEVADGVDGCIRAVRRQIGAGADWIKIYADYRARSRMNLAPSVANASYPLFNRQEIAAITETAHSYGVKVATHSTLRQSAANLGEVDSVEHTDYYSQLSKKTTSWVPTLSVFAVLSQGQQWEQKKANFKDFLKDYQATKELDVEPPSETSGLVSRWKIACGGDVGPYAHGDNALEMQYMYRLGASWKDVLRWCTYGGWECLRPLAFEGSPKMMVKMTLEYEERAGEGLSEHEYMFGAIRKGWSADIIGVNGDLENDFERTVSSRGVEFVMKCGRVYKKGGINLI